MSKKQQPYVYDYYNVTCYTPNPKSILKNIMARMVNALVKALNGATKLPRIILIIPDFDMLKNMPHDKEDKAMKKAIQKVVFWTVNQMYRAIEAKIDNLQRKNPGVIIVGEPKVIWVEAVNRPNGLDYILTLRRKFNDSLHQNLKDRNQHYVMNINRYMDETGYFDQFNQLNDFGKSRYWQQIDHHLELFDKKQIDLRPQNEEAVAAVQASLHYQEDYQDNWQNFSQQ